MMASVAPVGADRMVTATPVPAQRKPPLLLAGAVLAASNFMVVLDLTVANVSIPHIAGDLAISSDEGTWIITGYAVAEAVCVPLTGWLAQRFGAVRVFIMGMVGFGVFSLLCGLSVSLTMLVLCRIGQGLCGGPIMPMSQTLLLRLFPPQKRGMAMGLWAGTVTLGPALGPIIGGTLNDQASWHWVFLINVPIAALCVVGGYTLLRSLETPTARLPIDRIGIALMVFWIGCLQIMLDIGRDRDWFADPLIVVLAVMAAIGFAVFIIWELTEENPVVDLRVFRHRGFSTSVTALAMGYGAFFAGVVVIPQWLQLSMGYTATKAGFVTAFQGLGALAASQPAARLMSKVDPRILASGGLIWMALMTFTRTWWNTGSDFWQLAIPIGLQGMGIPFMLVPLTSVALGSVTPSETASGAGLQNFIRTFAVAISTSVVLTIWGDAQRVGRNDIVGWLQPAQTQTTLARAGLNPDQARQMISGLVDQEATALAIDHTFYITTALLLFAAVLIWISPKPKQLGMPNTGGH